MGKAGPMGGGKWEWWCAVLATDGVGGTKIHARARGGGARRRKKGS